MRRALHGERANALIYRSAERRVPQTVGVQRGWVVQRAREGEVKSERMENAGEEKGLINRPSSAEICTSVLGLSFGSFQVSRPRPVSMPATREHVCSGARAETRASTPDRSTLQILRVR